MILKEGVKFDGISAGALAALPVIEATHLELTGRPAVVTSILDGRHMRGSRHYTGDALDLRVWYTDAVGRTWDWAERMRVKLGPDYDVVYGDAKHRSHIHLEYDPT